MGGVDVGRHSGGTEGRELLISQVVVVGSSDCCSACCGVLLWCAVACCLQVARDEKLSAQQREHEARMARALERAAAPVFKKAGKPVMFRSQPLRKKAVVAEDDGNDDEMELEAYLAQDMV